MYESQKAASHELAEGVLHGTDRLEFMLLIDASGSMTLSPHEGMLGLDGVDQSTISHTVCVLSNIKSTGYYTIWSLDNRRHISPSEVSTS